MKELLKKIGKWFDIGSKEEEIEKKPKKRKNKGLNSVTIIILLILMISAMSIIISFTYDPIIEFNNT